MRFIRIGNYTINCTFNQNISPSGPLTKWIFQKRNFKTRKASALEAIRVIILAFFKK